MGVVGELHLEGLSVADSILVGLGDFVDETRLASNDNLGRVLVPLQVVDERILWQMHHAQGLVQLQVVMTIRLKEEDFSVASSSDKHGLRRRVGKFDDGCVVSLETDIELDVSLVD